MVSRHLNILCFVAVIFATSAKDCNVGNNVYADGEEFQIDDSGKCITFTCTDGSYKPTKKQCLDTRTGACKELGHTFDSRCVTYECKDDGGIIGFVITKKRCESDRGCRNPGEEFEKTFQNEVFVKTTCRVEGGKTYYCFDD